MTEERDDDPNRLLNLLNSMESEAKAEQTEPGVILKTPEWLRCWPSAEVAARHGVTNPLLKKHLRGVKFRSFTRDVAGVEAWERAAEDVRKFQNELNGVAGVIHPDPDEEPMSAPTLVRS